MKKRPSNRKVIFTAPARLAMVTLICLGVFFGACRHDTAESHDTYTCPMHPTVVSDRPGSCPVCGMDLVRKARPGEEVKITGELAKLLKSPNKQVISKLRTIRGTYSTRGSRIFSQGVITYDTRNIFSVPSRVSGRIEKLFVKSVFQKIAKGQKVAEVYSPELVAAQRELLMVLENNPRDKTLVDSAEEKLRLLGLQQDEIEKLTMDKKVAMTFAIYSPYSGYVATEAQTPNATETPKSPTGEMGGAANDSPEKKLMQSNDNTIVREGEYVSAGQVLFSMVNTHAFRVELKFTASTSVAKGDVVTLTFADGRSIKSVIDFVQPFYSDGENFSTARVNVSAMNGLRIGELVNAELEQPGSEGLWIPSKTIVDLGLDKIVFVKEKDVFKPRKIQAGRQSGDMTQVLMGLSTSDEIAESASYLVDSESFINYEQ